MCCEAGDLTDFLLRHDDTLDELYFQDVRLSPDTGWHTLLQNIRDHLSITKFRLGGCMVKSIGTC